MKRRCALRVGGRYAFRPTCQKLHAPQVWSSGFYVSYTHALRRHTGTIRDSDCLLLLGPAHPEQGFRLDLEVVRGAAAAKNGLRGGGDIETIDEQPPCDVDC